LDRNPGELRGKRCGGDGAGVELTIGAAADPAAKPLVMSDRIANGLGQIRDGRDAANVIL
jgi:hypothetical protein